MKPSILRPQRTHPAGLLADESETGEGALRRLNRLPRRGEACHRSAVTPDLDAARDILRRTYGHADFRGLQAPVITEILAGRSAVAVLPTGGGKSVCYQIPSLISAISGETTRPTPGRMSDG